ncbi:YbaB/EbfC family nucleoid-associated protein [Patescibacteria group bacterium]|nr:YbaB/EbfC family nucleoid-associated protein [Patescibacteria group bacterium]
MFNKLKQFQDIRSRAKQLQTELEKITVDGESGWGKVKVTVNGNQRISKISYSDEIIGDKEKLESLTKEAVNDAMEKLQKVMATKMKDIGGLDLAQDIQGMMGQN